MIFTYHRSNDAKITTRKKRSAADESRNHVTRFAQLSPVKTEYYPLGWAKPV